MKYIKLTAKPNTWFKEGTEVYDYDCRPPSNLKRMTLDSWNSWNDPNYASVCLARGIRIASADYSYEMENFKEGEEYWDGENCSCLEFDVEIVDEPF